MRDFVITYKEGVTALNSHLPEHPSYVSTMSRLAQLRQTSDSGVEFWRARDLMAVLGYDTWRSFEGVIERARASLTNNGADPSHHIAETGKMMGVGKEAQRRVRDFFLSRVACYLIAMNGDPGKPEVAAAQAYFVVRTRLHEIAAETSEDEKRLELRQKVSTSFKVVSGVAKQAGVTNSKQAVFHGARYQGLYEMSASDLKRRRGLKENDNPFDFMGALELSANDFQMNLAAHTIEKEKIRGERQAIDKNKEVARRVRRTMVASGSQPPETLPAAEPIKEVAKRVKSKALPPKNESGA